MMLDKQKIKTFIYIAIVFTLKFILTLNLSFGIDDTANAQPSWVYKAQGDKLKSNGDYGQALILYKKARDQHINEEIQSYYQFLKKENKLKTEFELKQITSHFKKQLLENDLFPDIHEAIGDIYYYSDLIDLAINEYITALNQKEYFSYKEKEIEIYYKLADCYQAKNEITESVSIMRKIIQFDKNFYFQLPRKITKNSYENNIWPRINKMEDKSFFEKMYEYLESQQYYQLRSGISTENKFNLFYFFQSIGYTQGFSDTITKIFKGNIDINTFNRLYHIPDLKFLKAYLYLGKLESLKKNEYSAFTFLLIGMTESISKLVEIIQKKDQRFVFTDYNNFMLTVKQKKLDNIARNLYLDKYLFFIGYIYRLQKRTGRQNEFWENAKQITESGSEIDQYMQYLNQFTYHDLTMLSDF